MTYDWKAARDRARLGQGGRGGGGGVTKTRSPKGFLLLNRGVANVIESLPWFDREEYELVYDVLMWIRTLEEETPLLTAANRKALMALKPIVDVESDSASEYEDGSEQLRFTDVTEEL